MIVSNLRVKSLSTVKDRKAFEPKPELARAKKKITQKFSQILGSSLSLVEPFMNSYKHT